MWTCQSFAFCLSFVLGFIGIRSDSQSMVEHVFRRYRGMFMPSLFECLVFFFVGCVEKIASVLGYTGRKATDSCRVRIYSMCVIVQVHACVCFITNKFIAWHVPPRLARRQFEVLVMR